jgi:hypothetical protein
MSPRFSFFTTPRITLLIRLSCLATLPFPFRFAFRPALPSPIRATTITRDQRPRGEPGSGPTRLIVVVARGAAILPEMVIHDGDVADWYHFENRLREPRQQYLEHRKLVFRAFAGTTVSRGASFLTRKCSLRGEETQDLLWKFNSPFGERAKVLKILDDHNVNAFSLFETDEALLETIALRELTFRSNTVTRRS